MNIQPVAVRFIVRCFLLVLRRAMLEPVNYIQSLHSDTVSVIPHKKKVLTTAQTSHVYRFHYFCLSQVEMKLPDYPTHTEMPIHYLFTHSTAHQPLKGFDRPLMRVSLSNSILVIFIFYQRQRVINEPTRQELRNYQDVSTPIKICSEA